MKGSRTSPFYALVAIFVITGLLVQQFVVFAQPVRAAEPVRPERFTPAEPAGEQGLMRTTVALRQPLDQQRLADLGVVFLAEGEGWAQIIVTQPQLETLARRGFQPTGTDTLSGLLIANPAHNTTLGGSVASLTASADEIMAAAGAEKKTAASLREVLGEITAEQQSFILSLATSDTDGDGLTDTEEAWWCTDAADEDSDGDLVNDGQEVAQLLAGNRSNGKPFLGWPDSIADCYDDDFDSMPDLAETNVTGLSVNRESSDLDKYDDGQEFFGSTYCPGGPGSCGYGALPRTEDLYLGSNMPSFVQVPGNSPWIAAFPDPSVMVVDGSLTVEAVTIITTDHTIGSGESHTYATSTTQGTSTTDIDLTTWNNWQDVSDPDDGEDSDALYLNPTLNAVSSTDGVLGALGGAVRLGAETWLTHVAVHASVSILLLAGCWAIPACAVLLVAGVAAYYIAESIHVYKETTHILEENFGEPGQIDTSNTGDEVQAVSQHKKCDVVSSYALNSAQDTLTCSNKSFTPSDPVAASTESAEFIETQDRSTSSSGTSYSVDPNSSLIGEAKHSGAETSPEPDDASNQQVTRAYESGGVKGTMTTEYSETTITEAEEFSSFESWSDATAVDSAHAADLRFSYSIVNDGNDILRELDGLLFNIYLGTNPNPIYTYNAIAQTGTLSNLQPGQSIAIASDPIPMTLQQMEAFDKGTKLFVTAEQLAYGGDQLFFQDAVNGGLIVVIDDGWSDSDGKIDLYVLPCYGNPCGSDPTESVQTVLQRGFPTEEDAFGNLLSISTPEVDPVVSWGEHRLGDDSWWNVYLSENISYTGALSTTLPAAGEAVVVRFLTDSDLDGFNDQTEDRLGTDPHNAASRPQPELLAGAVSERIGNDVAVTMAFSNRGVYDAAGVEVVAYAPDDTITILDNVIGGSGRVNSGHRVVLGGLVGEPDLANWTGAARPWAAGEYTGDTNKTYTVTASGNGTVGTGNLLLDWTDGASSGQVQYGLGYLSPTPLAIGSEGVMLGFNSGSVIAGDSFTVDVQPPGDTARYTINSEPYTPPVLVVSYNDPQGNHRFIAPAELTNVDEDLSHYSGQQIEDLSLDITTIAPFNEAGDNTYYVVANSPHELPIQNGHLFIEYINKTTGDIVAEQDFQLTLQPGPNIQEVTWNASIFSETFTDASDYALLAIWTDYEGNIIDTTVRYLQSFKEDPLPAAGEVPLAWNFGDIYEGEPLYREFTVADVGLDFMPAMASTDIANAEVIGNWRNLLGPAVAETFGLLIDTTVAGPINGTVTVRTSDLNNEVYTIPVTGNILPKPNLIIEDSDISFSNANPTNGQSIQITATVHNTATLPIDNVVVRFYEGDPLAGGVQIGGDQTLPSIPASSQAVANINWSYVTGDNHIHVTVDPEDSVPETDEYDNEARAFLNVGSTMPVNGVLDSSEVVLATDFASLTGTMVITGGATLIVDGVSGSLNSLTIGDSAALVLKNSNLTVTDILSDESSPARLVSVENASSVNSAKPIMIDSLRINLLESTINSTGINGYSPPTNGGSGTPGMPGTIELDGEYITIRGMLLQTAGGTGGRGALMNGSNPPAPGGNGGLASLELDAVHETVVQNSYLLATGGNGGKGGRSENYSGGAGGMGGEASLSIITGSLIVNDSDIALTSGDGGMGGEGDNHSGDAGGYGGSASTSSVSVEATKALLTESTVQSIGGDGGNGNTGGGIGGSGGSGGNSAVTASSADLLKLDSIDIDIFGGNGGLSVSGVSKGGVGGNGGDTTIGLSPNSIMELVSVNVTSVGGIGADGSAQTDSDYGVTRRGGYGGHGGSAAWSAAPETLFLDIVSMTLTGGAAGDGGGAAGDNLANVGGDGGDISIDWSSGLSWESTSLSWNNTLGAGGVGGLGNPNGADGSDGTSNVAVSDGNEGSGPGRELIAANDLAPNLFDLNTLDTMSARWDSGLVDTLDAPYRTSVPAAQGYHWLDLTYNYTDGTTAESHHRFYVTGSGLDEDNDGLPDQDELNLYGSDPVLPDTDFDGLDDGAEIAAGSDPLNPDSDYDGVLDGDDLDLVNDPDLVPAAPSPSSGTPVEDETIILSSLVSNSGVAAQEGIVVAFFDGDPEADGRYLCAGFIPSLAPGGSTTVNCDWTVSGSGGAHTLYVVADPSARIVESDETNNKANSAFTILSKPDLSVAGLGPAPVEVTSGESLTLYASVENSGDAGSGMQTVTFYDDGMPIGTDALLVAGNDTGTAAVVWSPVTPGPHTIRVVVDSGEAVNESSEGNNEYFSDAYVGFASPFYLDSGGSPDPAYDSGGGYGWSEGNLVVDWGGGAQQSVRLGSSGFVRYRYDHLLTSHSYHLDLTLFEGDDAGRIQTVLVDGVPLGGPYDLSDGRVHTVSLRVPEAAYQDHMIEVAVEGPITAGAVVSEITLTDIYYCYRDSGGDPDPLYGDGSCGGYVNQNATAVSSAAPADSYRQDLTSNILTYRFDGLDPGTEYQANLTVYRGSSNNARQDILFDGLPAGQTVETADRQVHQLSIPIPLEAYLADGSVDVALRRLDTSSGAFVNEIAVEEATVPLLRNYFSGCVSGTGSDATVVLPNTVSIIGTIGLEVGDEIAIFTPDGAICAGLGRWDGNNLSITAWGDDSQTAPIDGLRDQEAMRFDLWDFSEQKLHEELTVSFSTGNGVFSDNSFHVVSELDLNQLVTQLISLIQGWNMISSFVPVEEPALETVMADVEPDMVLMKNDAGQVFWPEYDINQIGDWNVRHGYQIYMTDPAPLSMTGVKVTPEETPIALSQGWSLISYLRETAHPIDQALGSIAGELELAKNGFGDAYWPTYAVNDIGDMEIGQGYKVYMNSPGTLTYPAND